MKTLRKHLELLGVLLSTLILFQSCVAYQQATFSLEQAANESKRAKVEMKSRETYRFQRIVFENGAFYGIKKGNDQVKIPLPTEDIIKVRLQDYRTSTVETVLVAIVATLGALFVIAYIDLNGGLDI